MAAPNRTTPSSANALALLAICIALLLLALGAFIWELRDPDRPDLGVLTIVLFVILGLVVAASTFGILQSSATISGTQIRTRWVVGGPAAIVVLFLAAGIYIWHNPVRPAKSSVVIDFIKDDKPLPEAAGEILLYFDQGDVQSISVVHGRARTDLQEAVLGRFVKYAVTVPGYVVKRPDRLTLVAGSPILVEMVPVATPTPTPVSIQTPPARPPDQWKLIWFDHFRPGRLYEVTHTEPSMADVRNNQFHQWSVDFDENRFEVLERVLVAKDEHWKVPPSFLSERSMPMLNERWFQIMDDEAWYAFRVRPRQ
jgi:hypothetical protein